jgi:hypothetical protein
MKKYITALALSLCAVTLNAQDSYPDSAVVIGYSHHWAATGQMSGNRVSVRDTRGWIHVVFSYAWGVHSNDSSEIFYVYSTNNGTTWSEMMNVSRTDSQLSCEPTLAVDSNDNLHCVWQQCEIGSYTFDLYYSMYDGISWSAAANITHQYCSFNASHYSSLVVDSNDRLHLIYEAPINVFDIFYMHYDGVSWSEPISISQVPWDAGFPCVAIDSLDNLHVIWRECIPNEPVMYTRYDGQSWSTPDAIAFILNKRVAYPCVVVNSQGYPRVIWCGGTFSDSFDIYYTAFDGSSWTSPLNLSNSAEESSYNSMAIDSVDNLYVIWTELTDSCSYELYYRTHSDSTWSAITNLTQDTAVSFCPKFGNPVKGSKVDLVWNNFDDPLPAEEIVYLGLNTTGIAEDQSMNRNKKVLMLTAIPNPFSNYTNIIFNAVQGTGSVELQIYDISGRLIEKIDQKIQLHSDQRVLWHAKNLPAGVYFVKLEGSDYPNVTKIVKLD